MEENSTTEDTSEEKQKQYTDAELETMRKETVEFYTSKNEVLKLQADHERYLAEIEESQLRQIVAVSRKIEIMAPAPKQDGPQPMPPTDNSEENSSEKSEEKPKSKKRPLKKN